MFLSGYMAACAMMNAGASVIGALSYPIGTLFNVPHGMAGGILLPSVIEHVAAKRGHEMFELIHEIYDDIGVPNDFSSYGITKKDIPTIVRATWEQRREAVGNTPFMLGEADLKAIMEKVV